MSYTPGAANSIFGWRSRHRFSLIKAHASVVYFRQEFIPV